MDYSHKQSLETNNSRIDGLMLSLASPEQIEKRSHGQVVNPETLNYRTSKPKMGGLFCEAIFGPSKNYECSCERYRGVRYKGIVCEKCGVEVTRSSVRRERMGHIELVSPVVHIWYYKASPSRIGLLLDLSSIDIEKILYYVKYIVVQDIDANKAKKVVETLQSIYQTKIEELDEIYKNEINAIADTDANPPAYKQIEAAYQENKFSLKSEFDRILDLIGSLQLGSTIIESDYRNFFYKYSDIFVMKSGAEAIQDLLANINIETKIKEIQERFKKSKGEERKKLFKLFRLLVNLYISDIKPEWMVIKNIPVIPPDLRPIVQLPGGKIATTDVNNFYRRVIQRNMRLKKMIQVGMPDIVKKNEIRLLQEAVNNLIVGDKTNSLRSGAANKIFKSLTDMLSGKEGIFRKNLLGKRVDYSGRSTITVGPDLQLDECGLPIYIAVKIFTPFIISKLLERNICNTPKQAEKMIREENPISLEILEEVIQGKYVLLNRAPTLHRLSIQAFKIKLMAGKTIRLHPLVCDAFNADFDGDQMAVHLPISDEAQKETKELIASRNNILKPSTGQPIISPGKDVRLGIYYLTKGFQPNSKTIGIFSSFEEVTNKIYNTTLNIHDIIKFKYNNEFIDTTAGRVLFNAYLPQSMQFRKTANNIDTNSTITGKDIDKIMDEIFDVYGTDETVSFADNIKMLGFSYATKSGVTTNIFDMIIPTEKYEYIKDGDLNTKKINDSFYKGFINDEEKSRLNMINRRGVGEKIQSKIQGYYDKDNDFQILIDSKARGNIGNLMQMSGIKGLVQGASGRVIDLPIKSSYLEGFSSLEIFISAHGARKGRADTALRTADAGYLTRRLCDSTQEVIVKEHDCNTTDGIYISKYENESEFFEKILGRVVAEDITDDKGNIILSIGKVISKHILDIIKNKSVDIIKVRSPLCCKVANGVCQKCFGEDLSTRDIIKIGTPIGIISSQSLGEPGTQLTMNTRHAGGLATAKGDITGGIERVNELLEARTPNNKAIISPINGIAYIEYIGKTINIKISGENENKMYFIKDGMKVSVKVGDKIKKNTTLASKGGYKLKSDSEATIIEIKKDSIKVSLSSNILKTVSVGMMPTIQNGASVMKGQVLSTGSLDVREIQEIMGDLSSQQYIIKEVSKIYREQAQNINEKFIEIIVKQMFSKVLIEDSGDSHFIPGSLVVYEDFVYVNEKLKEENKFPAIGHRIINGLTQIAKESDSRLSSASFQETVRVMVDNSLKGSIDNLSDLKSNVILGRKLPIGNNFQELNI